MTEPVYVYRARLNRVIDGDTYVFDVDLGFRVTAQITVRLRGLFTAESNQPGGAEATLRAQRIFAKATQIVLSTYKDRMSFTRWIADVWVDGVLLADLLATPPDGTGTRAAVAEDSELISGARIIMAPL